MFLSPRSATAALVLAALAPACRRGNPPAGAEMATLDGTLNDVFTQLASRARVPVVIDPTAHALAACARVRVTLPAGLAPSQLADLAGASVRGLGMLLSASSSAWVLSQPGPMRGPYPRECFGRGLSSYAPPPADPGGLVPAMPSPPPPPFAPQPQGLVALPAPDAGALVAALQTGITRRSDTEFDLTHAARDAVFDSLAVTSQQFRAIPMMTGGVVTGVRLFGIRRETTLSLLGFQNGDELQRVDGTDVTSPDRALEVYARIRNATSCVVQIIRRGMPTELNYRLVP
ncbi:MAG: hypothetical protein WCJ30_10545 [Deltaproteobacteria bacterium]